MNKTNETIKKSSKFNVNNINWTNVWSKKYPILSNYQKEVDTQRYAIKIRQMLEDLKIEYKYSDLDAMLVLKDILYNEWKNK